jgi:hypothetical protein
MRSMMAQADAAPEPAEQAGKKTATPSTPRKIPGNLPYLTASGTLKKALDRLQEASRPDKFNADVLENVLKLTGGAARATIPIMKKMGFLSSDATPTELYAKFRTSSGRGGAALLGLKNAFPEIFKRSEYAHAVEDHKLRDIILEITGLKPSDPVAIAIKSTFNVIKSYVPANIDPASSDSDAGPSDEPPAERQYPAYDTGHQKPGKIGLVYNINVVIPETADLKVLNAIFRSLKENLMQ